MRSDFEHLDNVAITRDNTILMDGAGSQLQRNYCTYALARFLNIAYIHSPLKEMSYQGLSALEKNEEDPNLTARYNKVFTIPSDIELPENARVHHVEKLDLNLFKLIQEEVKKDKYFHLIKTGFPYLITDQQPQMLDCVKQMSPFKSAPSPLFRIAIHVRRGELFVVDSHRMLPNSYYITVVQNIIKVLNNVGIPFICELHTELPTNSLVVTLDHNRGIHKKIKELSMITKEMSKIEDFEVIPHLKKCINHDPIETIESMATADLLVISRSSFSYLAGILNKRGLIVYHPFWHGAPPAWLNVHEKELLDQKLHQYCIHWQKKYE